MPLNYFVEYLLGTYVFECFLILILNNNKSLRLYKVHKICCTKKSSIKHENMLKLQFILCIAYSIRFGFYIWTIIIRHMKTIFAVNVGSKSQSEFFQNSFRLITQNCCNFLNNHIFLGFQVSRTVFVHFCTQASLPKISIGARSGQGDLASQFMFPAHSEKYLTGGIKDGCLRQQNFGLN